MGTPQSPWVHHHRRWRAATCETNAWHAWPLSCKLLCATPYCDTEHLYGHRRGPVKSTSVAEPVWQENCHRFFFTTFVLASIQTPIADLSSCEANAVSTVPPRWSDWSLLSRHHWPSRRTRGTYTCCQTLSSEAVTTCSNDLSLSRPRFQHPTFCEARRPEKLRMVYTCKVCIWNLNHYTKLFNLHICLYVLDCLTLMHECGQSIRNFDPPQNGSAHRGSSVLLQL